MAERVEDAHVQVVRDKLRNHVERGLFAANAGVYYVAHGALLLCPSAVIRGQLLSRVGLVRALAHGFARRRLFAFAHGFAIGQLFGLFVNVFRYLPRLGLCAVASQTRDRVHGVYGHKPIQFNYTL